MAIDLLEDVYINIDARKVRGGRLVVRARGGKLKAGLFGLRRAPGFPRKHLGCVFFVGLTDANEVWP